MRLCALFLVLAGGVFAKTSTLVDDIYSIGPGRTRYLDIAMPVEPFRVLCAFEVESPADARIRAQLVSVGGEVAADSGLKAHGGFSVRPPRKGRYRLVLDNRSNPARAVRASLHVRVVYGEGPLAPVTKADPVKGQILVWSSMLVFASIALFAGARIKRNLDHRL
jgi:hypothetical protein